MITIWFPNFYTEAHRTPEHRNELVKQLHHWGIKCLENVTEETQLIFCGGFLTYHHHYDRLKSTSLPVVHYSWDLYPEVVERNQCPIQQSRWDQYLDLLRECTEVWVPSTSCGERTRYYTQRPVHVIKAPVHPWEPSKGPTNGNYIVNVMRRYPWDPNVDLLSTCCKELNIPLVEPSCNLGWDEFKDTVANAKFLVSPYFEASTGGLTLLEGYWHGKSILISNSPFQGAVEYFGKHAHTFQWNSRTHLKIKLQQLWNETPLLDVEKCRAWLTENYSESVFAKQIADRIKYLLNAR